MGKKFTVIQGGGAEPAAARHKETAKPARAAKPKAKPKTKTKAGTKPARAAKPSPVEKEPWFAYAIALGWKGAADERKPFIERAARLSLAVVERFRNWQKADFEAGEGREYLAMEKELADALRLAGIVPEGGGGGASDPGDGLDGSLAQ